MSRQITSPLTNPPSHPLQNASAFWELLGAITAINPPREPEQATFYASLDPIGLSLRGFGFDPNNLTTGTLGGMNAGLAAALGCVVLTAQARQKASITSTRWEPLLGMGDHGSDCTPCLASQSMLQFITIVIRCSSCQEARRVCRGCRGCQTPIPWWTR